MTSGTRGSPPYFLLLGMVLGMLVAGVAVPLAVGDRQADVIGAGFDSGATSPDGFDVALEPSGAEGLGEGSGSGGGGGAAAGGEGGGDTQAPAGSIGSGPSGSGGSSGPGGGGSSALGATDRGVSATTIKVGIMILDLGGLSAVGISVPGTDPEQQRQSWRAWIADINRRGGIGGRKIDPYFRNYDLLDEDDQRAACLDVNDQKVFAVFDAGGMGDAAVLCFTQEHDTPVIALGGQGFSDAMYQRSAGLLFSTFPSGGRSLANYAFEIHRMGELADRTIGVLSEDGPGYSETIERGLLATLDQLGYEVVHHAHLSADRGTASGQIPVVAGEMRSNGVDTVLLLSTVLNSTQFVQEAEKQVWFPRYWVGDWGGGYTDVYVQNMPDSFDGHLVTTVRTGEWRQDRPEPPPARTCRELYEKETGQELDITTAEYAFTLRGCTMMRIFEMGATAAGGELTRARLSGAIQGLGQVPLATFGGGGFRPGKFDAADDVRRADYDSGCGCWLPANEFRPGRFR